jgi:transposase
MTGDPAATGEFRTDARSYRQLLKLAQQWPERIWAVEGANGIGRPITQRLLASGERVLDVPAKLAARARVFDTGQGRKTDAADAHAIVMVALRDKGPAAGPHRPCAGCAADAV